MRNLRYDEYLAGTTIDRPAVQLTRNYSEALPSDEGYFADMTWAEPQHTKGQVDRAGEVFINPKSALDEWESALGVINNWRSSHHFPLNTFQVWLRKEAREVDPESLVAQRIKRLFSIRAKLRRFPTIRLSQMQDIGGCRAVVESVAHVNQLVSLYMGSDLKHKLDHIDDYIKKPQRSGYRGVHLIYRYFSDRKATYNGLNIEVQLRSLPQHAWATAVETVGTFTRQALKSSFGEVEWLRFFALMGSALAMREQTLFILDTPRTRKELTAELSRYVRKLNVETRLLAYGAALKTLEQPSAPSASYFLLELNPVAQSVTIKGYRYDELEKASEDYLATERNAIDGKISDAVLVSVNSIAALHRAYPNYFLDTRMFLEMVKREVC